MKTDETGTENIGMTEEIHEKSTLSTEMSTNVDNSVEYDEDKCTTVNNSEEKTVDNVDKTNEYVDDSIYYYSFYSFMYRTVTEKTVDDYEKQAFLKAYKSTSVEKLTDYFSDICWITRNGEISLSMSPKEILFPENNENAYIWMSRCMHAFELIRNEYSSDERWGNPDSLKPQFHCHAVYARQKKQPWNIEPFRTETDFIKIVMSKGNPQS